MTDKRLDELFDTDLIIRNAKVLIGPIGDIHDETETAISVVVDDLLRVIELRDTQQAALAYEIRHHVRSRAKEMTWQLDISKAPRDQTLWLSAYGKPHLCEYQGVPLESAPYPEPGPQFPYWSSLDGDSYRDHEIDGWRTTRLPAAIPWNPRPEPEDKA